MDDLFLSFPSDEDYWRNIFSKTVANTGEWIFSAKSLRLAADALGSQLKVVWEQIQYGTGAPKLPDNLKLHPAFLMLSSYAAENYLKARIVSVNNWSDENIGRQLPKVLKSHNLAELSEHAGAHLRDEESDLIDRLSEYALWAGRYPCPLSQRDLLPKLIGGKTNVATFFRGSDIAVSHCLLERLEHLALHGQLLDCARETNGYDGITIQERVTPW